jgi:hypothetical protein
MKIKVKNLIGLIVLMLLVFSNLVMGQALIYQGNVAVFGGAVAATATVTPFWTETFEGANSGCDNTPLRLSADPDSTAAFYDGAQACDFNADTEEATFTLSQTNSELWLSFVMRVTALGAFSSGAICTITMTNFSLGVQGTLNGYKTAAGTAEWRTTAQGGTTVDNDFAVQQNTNLFCLIHAKSGTGSDAVFESWITTNGDFSGSANQSSSNGTNTQSISIVRFFEGTYDERFWVDGVKAYASKPSSY